MVESYLDGIIQELTVNSIVSSFKVLKRAVGEEDGYIRIKCGLSNGDLLEFAEYIQFHRNSVHIKTYSYHWQSADGNWVKRWDNVRHHQEINTYPYHVHLPDDTISDSNAMNLKDILTEIEKSLSTEA